FLDVVRDDLVAAVCGLTMQHAGIVDVDITHARGKRRRPCAFECEWSGRAAWRELNPAFVLALDQQRVPRRRPAKRVDHRRIEKLARESELVVDDPKARR